MLTQRIGTVMFNIFAHTLSVCIMSVNCWSYNVAVVIKYLYSAYIHCFNNLMKCCLV